MTDTVLGISADVLDSMTSGVVAVDREDRVVWLNLALARILGVERDSWLGRSFAEFAQLLESCLSDAGSFRASLEAPNDSVHSSCELELRRGEQVYDLREDHGPLRDSSGTVIGRIFAFHDISREKNIDRMKSEFISVASHELRTPMTSIKGSIDLILSGFAGEISTETQELLEIAHKSCERLIRLINDILDLSKIEAGQTRLKLAPMNLLDVVERSVNSVRSFADQNDVRLTIRHPEDLPLIDVDRDRIEQVITNLLSNAIKFSPPSGEVVVELRLEGDWLHCAVIDQGCGIAPEDLERVFGKFQQLGDGRRRGGTGLGLAISQALVHEHRGEIWVESTVGAGSRFIFRLPAADSSSAASA